MNEKIILAKDFSDTPGGRTKDKGEFSGEEFRESLLKPRYIKCRERGVKLFVDLDGCFGYPSSFLDEAFGELARFFSNENIFDILELKSDDQPGLIGEIMEMCKKK